MVNLDCMSNENSGFEMSMSEFKGSVIAQLSEIRINLNKICEDGKKREKRITVLELWKTDLIARMAVIISVFTIGLSFVWDTIKDKIKLK